MCFLAGGVRNEVIGFDKASKVRAPYFSLVQELTPVSQCVWALSQVDIWGQFLIIDYKARTCLYGPWRESSSWDNLGSNLPLAVYPSTANPSEAPILPLQATTIHTDTASRSNGTSPYADHSRPPSICLPPPGLKHPPLPACQSSALLTLNSSNAGLIEVRGASACSKPWENESEATAKRGHRK